MGQSLLGRAAARRIKGQKPPQEMHRWLPGIAQVPASINTVLHHVRVLRHQPLLLLPLLMLLLLDKNGTCVLSFHSALTAQKHVNEAIARPEIRKGSMSCVWYYPKGVGGRICGMHMHHKHAD